MQEQEQTMELEQGAKKKPTMAIVVSAVAAVLLLAALFVAHSIIDRGYQTYLGQLKGLIAEQAARFEQGDPQADYNGQYRLYLAVDAELANLSDILAKLNDRYPVLLTKANEKAVGLADLKAKMEAIKPALASFKEAADEDGAIAGELSAKLGQAVLSAEYADLLARNTAAAAKLAGSTFTGALESNRAALADGLAKRGVALEYLVKDCDIAERFAASMADTSITPDDAMTAINSLIAENEALAANAEQANLPAFGAGGATAAQAVALRQTELAASVAYFGEIKTFMAEVVAFNTKLDQGRGQGVKFTERLAAWMAWVKDLNTLQAKLDGINGKPEYAALPAKRALELMGFSETGLALSGYAPALTTVNGAMASSTAIEKEIAAMLKSKARMQDKVTISSRLLERNEMLLAKLNVELPQDLAEGLANFTAACQERNVFLSEYVAYVKNQAVAEGQAANRSQYLSKYNQYKNLANSYPAGSSDRTFYQNLASDQSKFAAQALAEYNEALKSAKVHKAAYEASRKKYVPMLDKVD